MTLPGMWPAMLEALIGVPQVDGIAGHRRLFSGRSRVLEPVINFGACDAGSQFLAIREAKSAVYLAYVLGASRAYLVKTSDFFRDKRQSGPWTSAALRPAVAASW